MLETAIWESAAQVEMQRPRAGGKYMGRIHKEERRGLRREHSAKGERVENKSVFLKFLKL